MAGTLDMATLPYDDEGMDSEDTKEEVWCKMTSINQAIPSFTVSPTLFHIGRLPTNTLQIKDQRLSSNHCSLLREHSPDGVFTHYLLDSSSNGTFVNNNKVGKGKRKLINNGDEITLLRSQQVSSQEMISFVFTIGKFDKNEIKTINPPKTPKLTSSPAVKSPSKSPAKPRSIPDEEIKEETKGEADNINHVTEAPSSKKRTAKEMEEGGGYKRSDSDIKRMKIQSERDHKMEDELTCGICFEFMYQAVTLMPCLHNFCGGCYSDWYKKSHDCPHCRKEVKEVKKNALINNLIDNFLEAHPEKKRDAKELEDLAKRNIITMDVLTVTASTSGTSGSIASIRPVPISSHRVPVRAARGRRIVGGRGRRSVPQDTDYGEESPSPYTSSEEEVKTAPRTVFTARVGGLLTCSACGLRITARATKVTCKICFSIVCVNCGKRTARPYLKIADHKFISLPAEAFSRNTEEQRILQTFLNQKKLTWPQIYTKMTTEMENKKFKYRNTRGVDVALKRGEITCRECMMNVWVDLVYRYRVTVHNLMPAAVKSRPNCWYGKECLTASHNPRHAQNFNHICENTKR